MSDDLVKRLREHAHWGMTAEAADRIEALEGALAKADFLIDRINDWSPDGLTDENCSDWIGHVEPALARYREARKKLQGKEVHPD